MHPVLNATLAYVQSIDYLNKDINAPHNNIMVANWNECAIITSVVARCEVPGWVSQAATGAHGVNEAVPHDLKRDECGSTEKHIWLGTSKGSCSKSFEGHRGGQKGNGRGPKC